MSIREIRLYIREKGVRKAFVNLVKYITKRYLLGTRVRLSIINALRASNRTFYKKLKLCVNGDDSQSFFSIGTDNMFPFVYEPKDEFIKTWEDKYTSDVNYTLKKAKEFANHKFIIFDQALEFEDDIDWHKDPLTKRSWPKKYYGRIDYYSDQKLSDIKYSWELNKHHHFVTLGKAYYYTKDERYAKEFTKQISSWMKQNQFEVGINWIGNMQIAQRIISWIISYHFFNKSNYFKKYCLEDFLKSIYYQAEILFNKRHAPRNNHRIGAICGIIITGLAFPEFKKFNQWINDGFEELEEALEEQIFQDGVDKEQTISYQKAVIELLLLTYTIVERNNLEFPEQVKKKLHQMITHLAYLTTPDEKLPIVGDNSDERGFIFSEVSDFWDVKTIISAGAVIFNDPLLKTIGKTYTVEDFWLLGMDGYKKWDSIQPLKGNLETAKSFKKGGHFIIRSDWERNADYLFVRCGEFGFNKACAHSHCDLLGVILYVLGKPVLVDSGTFRYNTTKEIRDYYRKASAHNTVQVDDDEQARMEGTFKSASRIIVAKCLEFKDGYFKGYMKSETGIKYIREITRLEKGCFSILDTIGTVKKDSKPHTIRWFFNIPSTLEVNGSLSKNSFCIMDSDINIEIGASGGGRWEIGRGFISPRYGRKERCTRVCFLLESSLPISQSFKIHSKILTTRSSQSCKGE